MIKDFIDWAFYGDVNNKPVDTVYKSYLCYCTLFGYDNCYDNKELMQQICSEYSCMISKGNYVKTN